MFETDIAYCLSDAAKVITEVAYSDVVPVDALYAVEVFDDGVKITYCPRDVHRSEALRDFLVRHFHPRKLIQEENSVERSWRVQTNEGVEVYVYQAQ